MQNHAVQKQISCSGIKDEYGLTDFGRYCLLTILSFKMTSIQNKFDMLIENTHCICITP